MHRIVTYIKMILLYIVLGVIVLYFAGEPLASYFISKGNMMITQGAPGYSSGIEPKMPKLVMDKNNTMDQSEILVPELETQYGTITCDRIALSAPVYYGDSEVSLHNGVAQYPNGYLPGEGKPLLIGGHDATYFVPLEDIKIGDVITITTDYGTYQYAVVSKIIAEATDPKAYDLSQEKEQLILYTCYPFGQLVSERSKRFFVYCDRIIDSELE